MEAVGVESVALPRRVRWLQKWTASNDDNPSSDSVGVTCYPERMNSTLIALISLVVSVASAGFTGWQAIEMRRARRIEEQRRHHERTPEFRAEVEPLNEGAWHRLWIVLTTPEALDSLTVTILEPHSVWFPPEQTGVEPASASKNASWGLVEPGMRNVAFRIEWEDDNSGLLRLSLRGTRGPEIWNVQEAVELPEKPYDVSQSIY